MHPASGLETDDTACANDEMIHDLDSQQPSGLDEATRHLEIMLRGARIAGGVVVRHDDRGGRGEDRFLEELSWMDQRRREAADRHRTHPDELVAVVQEQRDEMLFLLIEEVGAQECFRGLNAVDESLPLPARRLRRRANSAAAFS